MRWLNNGETRCAIQLFEKISKSALTLPSIPSKPNHVTKTHHMNIDITLTEHDLKPLVVAELARRLGELPLESSDVTIEVKSKQNYRAEWEKAAFRARVTVARWFPFFLCATLATTATTNPPHVTPTSVKSASPKTVRSIFHGRKSVSRPSRNS